MHKYNLAKKFKQGFVLPTVLVVSIIMLSALTLSLSVVWASRQSLKEQFDIQNARNAAISGVNVAEGCRYGNIVISESIMASAIPLGQTDCGKTAATSAVNPLLLKNEYGSATSGFGFSASYIKNSAGEAVLATSSSGYKSAGSGSFQKQRRMNTSVYSSTELPLGPGTLIYTVKKFQCDALPIFNGTNISAIRTLLDDRDGSNKNYRIARLADGNCWMLDNLRLGSTAQSVTLTSANSSISGSFVLPKVVTNGLSYDTPVAYGPIVGDPAPGNVGGYGFLYNWPAATAGDSQGGYPYVEQDSPASICPRGWRLPSGKTTGEFADLDRAFGGTGSPSGASPSQSSWLSNGAFNGLYSGLYVSNFTGQGTRGVFWSRTSNPTITDGAYSASFTSNYIEPGTYTGNTMDVGLAVRCLLK